MGSELLPCPFCGSAARGRVGHARTQVDWRDGLGSPGALTVEHHKVECINSQCMASAPGSDEADAVRTWNRRAP